MHRDGPVFVGPRTCTDVAPRSSRFPGSTEQNPSKRTVLVPGCVILTPHDNSVEGLRQEPLHESRSRILPRDFMERTALSEATKETLNYYLW